MSNRTEFGELGASQQCVTKYSTGALDYATAWSAAVADDLNNALGQTGNLFNAPPQPNIWTISRGIFSMGIPTGVAIPGFPSIPAKFGDASDLVSVYVDQILLVTAGSLPGGTFLRMLHNPSAAAFMTRNDYGPCGLVTNPNLSPDIDISGGVQDPVTGFYYVSPAAFDVTADGITDLKNQWPNSNWFLLRCSNELNGIAANDMIEEIGYRFVNAMARLTIT